MAESFLKEEKLPEACRTLQEMLGKNPINMPAHLQYQDLMLALGRKDELLEEYGEFLKNRGDALAYLLYGRLLENEESRRQHYGESLRMNPRFHWAPFAMGQHFLLKGEREEAEKWFRKALEIYPCFPDALLVMGRLTYGLGEWQKCEEYYQRYLDCNPKNGTAHYEMGLLWAKRKNFKMAKREFRKALAIEPDDPWILLNLGNVLREENEPEEAIGCYEKAIVLAPRDPEAYLNLGILYEEEEKAHDIPKAIEMYKKYLELGGSDRVRVGIWIENLEKREKSREEGQKR